MPETTTERIDGYGELPALRRDELPDHVTMVFDGHCGMCTRSARYLARLAAASPPGTSGSRVDVLASQDRGVIEGLGLDADDAARAVWTIGGEPRIAVGGPRSIALAIAVGRRTTLPLWPLRVPPVACLLDAIYGWIADHRGSFPGESPWCEQHPERCASARRKVSAPSRARSVEEGGEEVAHRHHPGE